MDATTTPRIVQKYARIDASGLSEEYRPGTVGNPYEPPVSPDPSLRITYWTISANAKVSSEV